MQISDYLGQYANSLANASNASPAAEAAPKSSTVQNLVSTLSELQEGTVFEGSVNSVDGSKILLGLSNGQTISARLDGSVNLLLGQSVFFQVKSNDGSTIAIKPYAGGRAFNPTIQKALHAAGMEASKDTIDMVNRMMEEGMPIDKNSLLAMRHTLMQNPGISMQTAVTMSRLGIPVNEQMAAQFENYQNDRHMMLNQMEQVMEQLPSAYGKVTGSASDLVQFNQQILDILRDGMPKGDTAPVLFAGSADGEALQAEGAALPQEALSGPQGAAVQEEALSRPQDVPVQAERVPVSGENAAAHPEGSTLSGEGAAAPAGQRSGAAGPSVQVPPEEAAPRPGQAADASREASAGTEARFQPGQAAGGSPEAAAGAGAEPRPVPGAESRPASDAAGPQSPAAGRESEVHAQEHAAEEPRQAAEVLGRHGAAELEAQLKKIFPEAQNLKLNTQQSAKELLDAIAGQLKEHPLDDKREALSKLFSGREYHALLKETMEQQWTLRPEALKTRHKVEELYQRLDRQMSQIEQLAKQTGMHTGQLSRSAADVRSNIEFMNQINQAYTYVQIPLKLANQNAHSELYVYTNKRSLQKKEGELSAFLHLDLEHLGSTDVSIKMLDKNVNTKFYLADDAAYDLIEQHLPKLQERLMKLGYNCSISIENREEKVDFVEDFLQKGQPAKAASRGMVHRYSFDVRA